VHPPHGGVRHFHEKSTCLTQLTLGRCVVQIWSRNPPKWGNETWKFTKWYHAAHSDRRILSGRVFMMNTRTQRRLLHTWIIRVIAKQHLVQFDRKDGRSVYLSYILAGIRSIVTHDKPLTPTLRPSCYRENLEQTRESRQVSVEPFGGKRLLDLSSCSLLARKRESLVANRAL
jgi:hypothetical protein